MGIHFIFRTGKRFTSSWNSSYLHKTFQASIFKICVHKKGQAEGFLPAPPRDFWRIRATTLLYTLNLRILCITAFYNGMYTLLLKATVLDKA